MAFIDIEVSDEDGRPVILYQFTHGNVIWRYTSAEDVIDRLGFDWLPAPMTDDGVKQTSEVINDAMSIECPSWIGPAQISGTSRSIQVAIFATHEQSPDTRTIYLGEVTQVNYPMPGRSRLRCETFGSTMQREGLRLGWQRSCPYVLYDPLTCKVDKADWGVAFVVLAIDDYQLSIELDTSKPSAYFDNGFLEWAHPLRGTEFLFVDSHSEVTGTLPPGAANAVITLSIHPGDLFVGAAGTIYPGCNFTPADCDEFDNYPNYGGHESMPGKSPFDGDPVF